MKTNPTEDTVVIKVLLDLERSEPQEVEITCGELHEMIEYVATNKYGTAWMRHGKTHLKSVDVSALTDYFTQDAE